LTPLRTRLEAIVLWGVRDDRTGRTRAVMRHQDMPSIQCDSLVEVRRDARTHDHTEDQTTHYHQCEPNRDDHRKHVPKSMRCMSVQGCRSIELDAIHGDVLDG